MNDSEPLLTISDVMNLLDNRGISYDNKQKAEDTLRNMSLFRLKGYLYPFEQDHATHLPARRHGRKLQSGCRV